MALVNHTHTSHLVFSDSEHFSEKIPVAGSLYRSTVGVRQHATTPVPAYQVKDPDFLGVAFAKSEIIAGLNRTMRA